MIIESVRIPAERVGTDWPFTVPAIHRLAEPEGLRFSSPVTFLVGANGSGKSTLVEALAEGYGIDVRGGHAGRRYSSPLDRSSLGEVIALGLGRAAHGRRGRRGRGFFLRSETALGMLEEMGKHDIPGYGSDIAELSHGESYLRVFSGRFGEAGLYLLDEPEAGLAFEAQLQLLVTFQDVVRAGGQVICATHSPILTAYPDAMLLELSNEGIRSTTWGELEFVRNWRAFLESPTLFVRHLLDPTSS